MRMQPTLVWGAVAAGLGIGACQLATVRAAPARPATTVTSPSVRHAALLKYAPPPGWIRHYLGDDRYKIDGKIWRVVSTQMDTFYHRPDCPNMLRQPSAIVIGFPSGEDAVEAGYNPDPVCHPEEAEVVYAGGPTLASPATGVSAVAQTMSLGDGSSVTVPAGWQRVAGVAQSGKGFSISVDAFKPPHGTGVVSVSSITLANLPPNMSLDRFLTPEGFKSSLQGNNSVFNSSGVVSSQFNQMGKMLDNLSVTSATLGGMRGVMLKPKRGAVVPGMRGSVIMVGRGQKLYAVEDKTNGAPGADTFIKSFQPR